MHVPVIIARNIASLAVRYKAANLVSADRRDARIVHHAGSNGVLR